MGLAVHLGVDDVGAPLMQAACRAWPRWCAADPELAVVVELTGLPAWRRHASRLEMDAVLVRLAALTEFDADAATALAWLLSLIHI